jgi:AraC family transcriptional regulator
MREGVNPSYTPWSIQVKESVIQRIKHLIKGNYGESLPLETLAKHAFMSPFHFQRNFKNAVGESPKKYLLRIRLEAAAHQILLRPEQNLLSLALDCGFNSLENFSRAFKKYYTVSPDQFRKMPEVEKIALLEKINTESGVEYSNFDQEDLPNIDPRELSIEVKKMPAMKLVFLNTNLASTEVITQKFREIRRWAQARELTSDNSEVFGLMMDYPLFTALDKCHYLACISVTKEPEANSDVLYKEISPATYLSIEVGGNINQMLKQVTVFWKLWLPTSGYRMIHDAAMHIPKMDIEQVEFEDNTFKLLIKAEPK